jgi:hypothetical protein
MSALVELQERIQATVVRIKELERAARQPGAPRSLFVGIRSLEKIQAELEHDFAEVAKDEELGILKYRLLPEYGTRPSITAIANAWSKYQAMFSSVYDALLKQQTPSRKRTRTSKQAKVDTEFAFAYTFSGSIGVALTLPTGQMTDLRARALEEVNIVISDMAAAQNSEELAGFVDRLGVPPVIKFGSWVDSHIAFEAGAGIEWEISQQPTPPSLLIQVPEFRALKEAMNQITEPQEVTLPMTGVLTMADMDKRTFRMLLDSGERINGTFADAITEEHRAELPRGYEALIRTTTKIHPAIEKKEVSRFLVQLLRDSPT